MIPEMTTRQKIEMLREAQAYAQRLAEALGKTVDYVSLEEDDVYYDPYLAIDDTYRVLAYMDPHPDASGMRRQETPAPRFLVGHPVFIPGVRYYPDGSGEPDSEDFAEDEVNIPSAKIAVRTAIILAEQLRINQAMQYLDEQDMEAEQEQINNMIEDDR